MTLVFDDLLHDLLDFVEFGRQLVVILYNWHFSLPHSFLQRCHRIDFGPGVFGLFLHFQLSHYLSVVPFPLQIESLVAEGAPAAFQDIPQLLLLSQIPHQHGDRVTLLVSGLCARVHLLVL